MVKIAYLQKLNPLKIPTIQYHIPNIYTFIGWTAGQTSCVFFV